MNIVQSTPTRGKLPVSSKIESISQSLTLSSEERAKLDAAMRAAIRILREHEQQKAQGVSK